MTLPATNAPDLGTARGLSPATLKAFHVRHNGTGWEYDYQYPGGTATRWKAYDSSAVPKYRFVPSKPDGGDYFYPPGYSLPDAIGAAQGQLYVPGGEMGVMALWEAGIRHVTCMFGDGAIPKTLTADFSAWRVAVLYLIPDRDESGLKWAVKVRDALRNSLDIQLEVVALPYPLEASHGKDINDFWLEKRGGDFRTALASLPLWHLPEPEPEAPPLTFYEDAPELPARFLDAVERALGDCGGFNGEGWSRKHVRCPFHDDSTPSANWNNQLHILRCQSTCGKSYLAKETGEALGLHLRDYLDSTPRIPVSPTPVLKIVEKPAPVETPVEPPAPTPKASEKRLAPPLPKDAQLTPAQEQEAARGRQWLDDYVRWASECSPLSPDIVHEAIGLWLVAALSTRRVRLTIGGENIFPNLYVLIVAKTTLYRKTSAMKLANKMLDAARLNFLLLSSNTTPEALFDSLAGVKPANYDHLTEDVKRRWLMGRVFAAQRSVMKDEVSSILGDLKKDYMSGLSELLLQGYDGDAGTLDKELKSRGLISVKDLCLSFLGATTPVMYSKYVGIEERENGFVARFALITPERIPAYQMPSDEPPAPDALAQRLRHAFLRVLPWTPNLLDSSGSPNAALMREGDVVSPPAVSAFIDPEALEQLNLYRKALGYDMQRDEKIDDTKAGPYARLGTMAFKVALGLALMDTDTAPIRIQARHAYAAQVICERWRESLHRLDIDVAKAAYSGNDDKVLAYLRTAGALGATLRDIQRDCALKDKVRVQESLTTLAEAGLIEKYERKPEGRGRTAICFRVVEEG